MKSIFNKINLQTINIEFSKKLTKEEKKLINSIPIYDKNITLSIKDFEKILGFSDNFSIQKFLLKFMNKNLYLSSQEEYYFYSFSIIESFQIYKDSIIFTFSDEFIFSQKKGTIYEILGLDKIIKFKEKYSYKIFHYINKEKNSQFNISIATLRDLLEIGETYDRFFDLEKYFLKPIFKDIEKITGFKIDYEKIKIGIHSSSKITGILINIKRDNICNSQQINEIIKNLKNEIEDFSSISTLLNESIKNEGIDYVKNIISNIRETYPNNFEFQLKKVLSSDNYTLEPLNSIQQEFKTLFELHTKIFSLLKDNSIKNLPNNFNIKLLVKLYSLKDNQTLTYKENDFFLKIYYKKNSLTTIEWR